MNSQKKRELIEKQYKQEIPSCIHCKKEIEKEDLQLQSTYWTPNRYMFWHKECHKNSWKDSVKECQLIDKDCNECKNFIPSGEYKQGTRYGYCSKLDTETLAYPGGTYCSFFVHLNCFESRSSSGNDLNLTVP